MSLGIQAAIKQLAKGSATHQSVALRLRTLAKSKTSVATDYMEVLDEIKRGLLLPAPALFCLVTDVIEGVAYAAAEQVIGTWEDYDENCREARDELAERLKEVVSEFLRDTPIPASEVLIAFEEAAEEFDRTAVASNHSELVSAEVARDIPHQFRVAGFTEMAELLERNPDEFKRQKQEGERLLIGQTYDEEREASIRKFVDEVPRQG